MALRTRLVAAAGSVSLVVVLVGCGGSDAGAAAGPSASARPAQEQVVITPADIATPFAMQAGRYKFGWETTDCKGVDFTLSGSTKGFSYAKKSALPRFSAIVSDVPEDTYMLAQADPACTTWTVRIDRVGK